MAVTSMAFDESFYLSSNQDVLAAVLNGFFTSGEQHWLLHGFKELRDPNENFDTSYYLINNTDVLAAGVNPLDHFVNHGATENRSPNASLANANAAADFDEAAYLAANTDVQSAVSAGQFTDGYQHWVLFGQFEGRSASTTSGTTLSGTNATAASTFTLTTAGDTIAGTTAADHISGGQGTLQSSDEISGGLGVDTLTVRLDNTTSLAPTVSGVEILNLVSRNASAELNFSDIKGVTAISVQGNSVKFSALTTGQTVQLDGAFTGTLNVELNSSTTAANNMTLDVNSASSASLVSTDLDVLTINVDQSTGFGLGSASDFSAVSALTVTGTGAFSLNLNSGQNGLQVANNSAAGDLTAINAAAAGGALTVNVGSATTNNLNITGSSANDVVTFYETFNNSDTFAGGAGTDELRFAVNTAVGLRANLSDVEILTLDVNANLSASMTSVTTGLGILNLRLGADVVFSGLAGTLNAVNIESGSGTAQDLTLGYSGSTDVTLNFNGGTSTALETTTQTATAITAGKININSNTGAVNVNIAGTAGAVTLETFSAGAAKSVTFSAASGSLTINSGVGLATATTLSMVANAGKSITIDDDLVAPQADNVTFNAAGASALIDLESAQLDYANTVTINANSAGTGALAFTAVSMTFSASTANAASGTAFDLTAININAGGGDVSIASANFLLAAGATAAGGALNATVNVAMESTANAVTLSHLNFGEVKTGQLDILVSGSGAFNIASAIMTTGSLQINVSTTGLSTASTATINMTGLSNAISGGLTVTLGNHGASLAGGSGADVITFGNGSQTAEGNGGDDQYTMSTAANVIAIRSALSFTAGTALGQDTVFSVGTGDVIVLKTNNATAFSAAATGTAATTAGTANLSGGGFVEAAWSAVSTAEVTTGVAMGGTAVTNPFAIFTSNGDTFIQVLLGTGAHADTAVAGGSTLFETANVATFVLDSKDITNITAQYNLNYDATLGGYALTIVG